MLLDFIHSFITYQWQRTTFATILLYPFSLLFYIFSVVRKYIYSCFATKLPVPIVVVGNIVVGGTGKTTFVISLCNRLQQQGIRVGIVSRGYKSTPPAYPFVVSKNTPVRHSGDEAKLIAYKTGAPIAIARRRVDAAKLLLSQHTLDVLISDDGMQHYLMPRDFEIAMIDGQKLFGNGHLLPAGPLREPITRLEDVDTIITTQASYAHTTTPCIHMDYLPSGWINLKHDTLHPLTPTPFSLSRPIRVVSAIGNPQGFYALLRQQKLNFTSTTLPDHATLPHEVLTDAKHTTIITEKDAIKCQNITNDNLWALVITPCFDSDSQVNNLTKRIVRLCQTNST